MKKFVLIITLILNLVSCTNKSGNDKVDSTPKKLSEDLCDVFSKRFLGVDRLFAEETYKDQLSKDYLVDDIMNQRRIEHDIPLLSDSIIKKLDTTTIFLKFEYAWKLLNKKKIIDAKKILLEIVNSEDKNSKMTLWAWNDLRNLGEHPTNAKLEGIVFEIPEKDFYRYLAIYTDKSVVYIDESGISRDLSISDSATTKIIDETISKSTNYLSKNKLKKGRTKLKTDNTRFSFLTIDGIFQIEKSDKEFLTKSQMDNQSSEFSLFESATRIIPIILNQPSK